MTSFDLSQNFSIDSPPFAFSERPTIGMPMDEAFPWPRDYQATHTMLFPKGVFRVENAGGRGEAAFCRFVAFVQA